MKCHLCWPVAVCLWVTGLEVAPASHHGWVTGRTVRIFQVPPTRQRNEAPVVTAIAVQPAGNLLAVGGDDHDINIWNMNSGKLSRKLTGHSDWIRCLAFATDGQTLASTGDDGRVLLWTVKSGQQPREIARHHCALQQLRFTTHGHLLATIGFQQDLKIYDSVTGKVIHQFSCPGDDMRALAFSPNGGQVAIGGRNGIIRVWNLPMGTIAFEVKAHQQRIRGIAYSPDGTKIVSVGEDRLLWIGHGRDGSEIHSLHCPGTKHLAISFLSAHEVAVAGSDNRIRIWNINKGHQQGILTGHTGSVTSLQSSGHWIVSGSYDTTVRLWRLERGKFDNQALRFLPQRQTR